MNLDDEAAEFRRELERIDAAVEAMIGPIRGVLGHELFVWMHSVENPNRCTVDHHCDFSHLHSAMTPDQKGLHK